MPSIPNTILETLWRRRLLILGITLLTCSLSLSLAHLQRDQFTATASFQSERSLDLLWLRIQSLDKEPILRQVSTQMDLAHNQIINDHLVLDNSVVAHALRAVDVYKDRELEPAQSDEDHAYQRLLENFRLILDPYSQNIQIQFTSISPGLGQAIANRILDGYILALRATNQFQIESDTAYFQKGTSSQKILYIRSSKPKEPILQDEQPYIIWGLALGLLLSCLLAHLADKIYILELRKHEHRTYS